MQSTASAALVRWEQDYTPALSRPKCSDPALQTIPAPGAKTYLALDLLFICRAPGNPLLAFFVSELRHELRESQQENHQQSKS